jgi:hypothetical protein
MAWLLIGTRSSIAQSSMRCWILQKVSSYDTSSDDEDDVDDAITQVHMEELSSTGEFTTPKERKASSVDLLDSESRLQAFTWKQKQTGMVFNVV